MSRDPFRLWGIDRDDKAFAEALARAALVEMRNDVAVLANSKAIELEKLRSV